MKYLTLILLATAFVVFLYLRRRKRFLDSQPELPQASFLFPEEPTTKKTGCVEVKELLTPDDPGFIDIHPCPGTRKR